ncbi:hypothetical protein [Sorangium sp. So ce693]|uniref:hypothetical protein n=1 Tax=Sorangium sp. So ce693 TaxID=3133318 RepID=UPI003F5FD447
MMKLQMQALTLGVVSTLAVGVDAAPVNFIYTRGDNNVNMSGSRCVAGTSSDEVYLQRSAGGILTSAPGGVTVFCPITRRSTAYYGVASDDPTYVDPVATVVKVYDAANTASVSCRQFEKATNGSISYGVTRYACSADPAQGCTTPGPNSWTGSGSMYFFNEFGSQSTMNWGLTCNAPNLTTINYYMSAVIPN